MNIHLDICWRFGQGAAGEFDLLLFALLEEIEAGGSLLVAAKQVRVSYRYAWGLMRKWEQRLGQPLADMERGRGAKLTALGEKVLWAQRRVKARLDPELESLASELSTEIAGVLAEARQPPLRVIASHGLALGILRDLVNDKSGTHLDLQFRGSLDSLRMLRAGKCDVAGFHLPEGELGARLAPRYGRFLHAETDTLIQVVRREQGIMTAHGNPKKIASVSDLARRGVRFVNRQANSGTRLILDLLLEEHGIDSEAIQGYDTEEFTHMAVAAMVASGAADAGFGIKAAASQFGLGFMPVARENYLFALCRDAVPLPAVTDICRVLRGRDYRRKVAALPGYDAGDAGALRSVEQILAVQP